MTERQVTECGIAETPATEQGRAKKRSKFGAQLTKWACAFPTLSAIFALLTEQVFFGRSAIWEVLRGTGEGG